MGGWKTGWTGGVDGRMGAWMGRGGTRAGPLYVRRLTRPVLPLRRGRRWCRTMRWLLARLRSLLVTHSPTRPHLQPLSPSLPAALSPSLPTALSPSPSPSPSPSRPLASTHPTLTLSIDPRLLLRPAPTLTLTLTPGAFAAAVVLSTARVSQAPRHALSPAAAAAASAEGEAYTLFRFRGPREHVSGGVRYMNTPPAVKTARMGQFLTPGGTCC